MEGKNRTCEVCGEEGLYCPLTNVKNSMFYKDRNQCKSCIKLKNKLKIESQKNESPKKESPKFNVKTKNEYDPMLDENSLEYKQESRLRDVELSVNNIRKGFVDFGESLSECRIEVESLENIQEKMVNIIKVGERKTIEITKNFKDIIFNNLETENIITSIKDEILRDKSNISLEKLNNNFEKLKHNFTSLNCNLESIDKKSNHQNLKIQSQDIVITDLKTQIESQNSFIKTILDRLSILESTTSLNLTKNNLDIINSRSNSVQSDFKKESPKSINKRPLPVNNMKSPVIRTVGNLHKSKINLNDDLEEIYRLTNGMYELMKEHNITEPKLYPAANKLDSEISDLCDKYKNNGGILNQGWETKIKNKYF